MSNFILYSDAIKYCERYGFKVPGNISAFELAEALLRAYKDGAKEFVHSYNCIGTDASRKILESMPPGGY